MSEYDCYRAELSNGWNKHVVKHVIVSTKDTRKILGVTTEPKELSLTEQLLLILTETKICPAAVISDEYCQIVSRYDYVLTRHEKPFAVATRVFWQEFQHRPAPVAELYRLATSRGILKFDIVNGDPEYTVKC